MAKRDLQRLMEAVAKGQRFPEPIPDETSEPSGEECDICCGVFSSAEIGECVACARNVCHNCSEDGLCEECACNLGECPHEECDDEDDFEDEEETEE